MIGKLPRSVVCQGPRGDLEVYLWEKQRAAKGVLGADEIIPFWRTCKGQVAEYSFKVGQHALKCAGTSGTLFSTTFSRSLRDLGMGLVHGFPAERGRLQTASMLVEGTEQQSFGVSK